MKEPSDPDTLLIRSFRRTGNRELLDELITRNISMVRSVVFQMVLDDTLADDLTQEAFLKALTQLPSFNGRSQFSTWLYRVAMNAAHDYLRREVRSPIETRGKVPEPIPNRNDRGPEKNAMESEFQHEVEEAIADLSPKLRAAIVLTSLQNLDVKEAAEIENCSTSTMYWRVHEARKRLKPRLERYFS